MAVTYNNIIIIIIIVISFMVTKNITSSEFTQGNTIQIALSCHKLLIILYKYSFYPRTIKDWNNLPISIIESRDLDEFIHLFNYNFCN